jgi:hypothetical protein
LAGALRVENILARIHYVVGAPCRLLIGFALTVGDHFGNPCDLRLEIRVGVLGVVDLFIPLFSDTGQEVAKCNHAVVGVLKGLRVGFILFRDLESLVCALTKCIPDGVGRRPLLRDKGTAKGALERFVKIREVRFGRSAISKSIGENRQCRSAHPLRTNQQRRPFTGRVIGHSHLHSRRIINVA